MEIIHVTLGKANPNRMNGVNKVVNSLATYQTKVGHDVTVWGITKVPSHNYPERNYKTVLFQETSKLFLPLGIKEEIKTVNQHAIFHFHGGFISQFIMVSRLLKKHGYKYVFTPHGSYNTVAMQRSNWKKKLYIFLFEKHFVAKAKALHFIGKSEIDGAKKIFKFKRYVLVPNGQNEEEIIPPTQPKKENKIPTFGFCGRLDIHTKGLDILFKGFTQYLRKNKGELRLIGDGKERPVLEKMAQELSIEKYVKFLGSQYGKDKFKAFNQLDYFILNSRNEGLPGVVLEAAIMGIPCLVSSATNMGEYIEENQAGICLTNNPKGIAKAMQQASDWKTNGKRSTISANALNMIKEKFNWKNIVNMLEELYA